MFQRNIVEKIKTHILSSVTFFSENRAFYELMWKNIVHSGHATDNSMAHAHCMLVTQGYKHTHTQNM